MTSNRLSRVGPRPGVELGLPVGREGPVVRPVRGQVVDRDQLEVESREPGCLRVGRVGAGADGQPRGRPRGPRCAASTVGRHAQVERHEHDTSASRRPSKRRAGAGVDGLQVSSRSPGGETQARSRHAARRARRRSLGRRPGRLVPVVGAQAERGPIVRDSVGPRRRAGRRATRTRWYRGSPPWPGSVASGGCPTKGRRLTTLASCPIPGRSDEASESKTGVRWSRCPLLGPGAQIRAD